MRIQRVIWAAIAASTFVYALIVSLVAGNPVAAFEKTLHQPFVMTEYAIALVIFGVALGWPAIARTQKPRERWIVRLALFEACAIFGLTAAFVAHDWRVYVAPWALAGVGFILAFPSGDAELSPSGRETKN